MVTAGNQPGTVIAYKMRPGAVRVPGLPGPCFNS
jgi:hypothetical protein